MSGYFEHDSAAQRYAAARPFFHPQVMAMVKEALQLSDKVSTALDVACGTGQSSVALLSLAEKVWGTDLSNAMLAQATENPNIHFQQAPAESLPFDDCSFELLTVCMAYHWFDQAAFLKEAERVLKRNGVIIVYNSHFPGIKADDPAFTEATTRYYRQFEPPPRKAKHPTAEQMAAVGFRGETRPFDFWVDWKLQTLTDYLCTQSSVINKVEQGDQSLEAAIADIQNNFAPFFKHPTEKFQFLGNVSIWQRAD